jgi:hypothetical protein
MIYNLREGELQGDSVPEFTNSLLTAFQSPERNFLSISGKKNVKFQKAVSEKL